MEPGGICLMSRGVHTESGVEFEVSGAVRTAPQWQVAWPPRLQTSCSVGSRTKCEHQPGAPWGQAPPPGIPIPTWQLESWGTTGFAGIFLPHILGLPASATREDWKLSDRRGPVNFTGRVTVDCRYTCPRGRGWWLGSGFSTLPHYPPF